MENFLKSLISFVLATLCSIYNGFLFHVIWGWFVVSLGMQPISTLHAMGLIIAVTFPFVGLYVGVSNKPDNDVETYGVPKLLILTISISVVSTMMAISGAIIHYFM